MAEALGTIRIDLLANMSEFTRSLKKGMGQLEDFGKLGSKVVKGMDASFQELGSKLSLKVTAPLVALAVAAVRAADPAKKMGQEMERAGLRMQKALEPLGKVLIQNFERLKPTIDAAIDTVNGMAVAFSRLSPETQQNILLFAGLAAATGPALLALSALTTTMKGLGLVFGASYALIRGSIGATLPLLYNVTKVTTQVAATAGKAATETTKMAFSLSLLGKSMLGLTTFFVAFKAGWAIYDSFKGVQQFMAGTIAMIETAWVQMKAVALDAFESIQDAWANMVDSIAQSASVNGALAAAADKLFPGAGNGFRAVAQLDRAPTRDSSAARAKIEADRKAAVDLIQATLTQSRADIEAAFKGQGDVKAPDFSPFTSLLDGASDLKGSLRDLLGGFKELGAGASQAFVQTSQEAEDAKTKSKELADQLKRDMEKAKDIRFSVYPREKLEADIKNLKELADKFPEILSPAVVKETVDKWTKDLSKIEEKAKDTFDVRLSGAIKNFSENVSDSFADMVVDGKFAFDELLRSFEKMLVSMVAKEYIFQPLLGAIGGAIGSVFAAPGSPAPRSDLAPGVSGPSIYEGSAARNFTGMPLGGSGSVVVNVVDQSGGVQVKQGRGQGGQTIIDILVPAMDAAFGSGKLDKAMKTNFGIPRTARY